VINSLGTCFGIGQTTSERGRSAGEAVTGNNGNADCKGCTKHAKFGGFVYSIFVGFHKNYLATKSLASVGETRLWGLLII
jgi:hypothetical protein